jgi:hypothetical protein
MKRPEVLLLVLGGGALAYFVLRQQQGGAGQGFTVTGGGQAQGGLGQLGATLGQALAAIPGIGPLLGAAAAVGGAGLDQWQKLPESDKRVVKRTHEKIHNLAINRLGQLDPVTTVLKKTGVIKDVTADRRSKRNNLIAILHADKAQREGAEDHAMRQLVALSRPDVQRWWIDQSGTTHVVYAGRQDAHRIPVPSRAQDPIAWAFELTSRIFGAPVQAGTGPVEGAFQTYDVAGFADSNPYAQKRWLLTQAAEGEAALMDSIARKH